MTTNKDTAIQKITWEFEALSNLVLEQLDTLNKVFEFNENLISEEIVQKLTENEKTIDNYDIKLDEHIIRSIVLYNPVASDLRHLFSTYRIVIDLERIGDLVLKIVKLVQKVDDKDRLKKISPMLNKMLKLTSEMVKNALFSFINKDKKAALWTIEEDIVIDEFNHKLLRKSIHEVEVPEDVRSFLLDLTDIRSIISSIERIGDHATNIAEASMYSILGKNVMHKDSREEKM